MSYTHREGGHVSYVGDGRDGRSLGERGRILAITGSSGHVKWADSSITLVSLDDVAPIAGTRRTALVIEPDELADSLDVGLPAVTGVRGMFAAEGSAGLLTSLASSGQLSTFASIAADTRTFVEQRLRMDPDLGRVTAQLDQEDADELITVATQVLLRDAFGDSDGR